MDEIREDLLHFIWENQLLEKNSLSVGHDQLEIIDPGQHNKASGPDFFNARIRIGNTVWAGNVEIHVKASDWYLHGHQDDPSYMNVILHAVYVNDCKTQKQGGEEIPCLEMHFDEKLALNYRHLVNSHVPFPCFEFIGRIEKIYLTDWFSKLMAERLMEKTGEVEGHLKENHYDWEETLYFFLGRSFGLKVNTYCFESLTRTTPLKTLLRSRLKSLSVNACLFGQAGFLEDIISEDNYYLSLQREYHSLVNTFPPRILNKHNWKFMGTRPGNFPLSRIAQFASLVVSRFPMFSELTETPRVENWRRILKLGVDSYWEDHYLFGKTGKKRKLNLGKSTMDLIILNAFIPVVFHYAIVRQRESLKESTTEILEKLAPEKNHILKTWEKCGIVAVNAFESQALIHLSTRYCRKKRCLECLVGNRIIKMK